MATWLCFNHGHDCTSFSLPRMCSSGAEAALELPGGWRGGEDSMWLSGVTSRERAAGALMGDTRVLAREQQTKVLALFRRGHSNMLFTTSVAEEGLDVQHCSLVICYDVPTRPLSLVQTVGRARARNGEVVFMEEATPGGTTPTVRRTLCMRGYNAVCAWPSIQLARCSAEPCSLCCCCASSCSAVRVVALPGQQQGHDVALLAAILRPRRLRAFCQSLRQSNDTLPEPQWRGV